MKSESKRIHMGMAYYLKKFWGANALAILPVLAVCALQTGTSLVMIQTFQSIIERDLRGFGFWILTMVGAWFLLLGINSLQDFFQGLRSSCHEQCPSAGYGGAAAAEKSWGIPCDGHWGISVLVHQRYQSD